MDNQLQERTTLPIASALALTYPVGAMFWAWRQGMPFPVGLGYGLSNLGYVLLVAVVFGSFNVFGLKRRWHILAAALGFWTLGVLAGNAAVWLGEGGHGGRAFFVVVPATLGILWIAAFVAKRERLYIWAVVVIVLANAVSRIL